MGCNRPACTSAIYGAGFALVSHPSIYQYSLLPVPLKSKISFYVNTFGFTNLPLLTKRSFFIDCILICFVVFFFLLLVILMSSVLITLSFHSHLFLSNLSAIYNGPEQPASRQSKDFIYIFQLYTEGNYLKMLFEWY